MDVRLVEGTLASADNPEIKGDRGRRMSPCERVGRTERQHRMRTLTRPPGPTAPTRHGPGRAPQRVMRQGAFGRCDATLVRLRGGRKQGRGRAPSPSRRRRTRPAMPIRHGDQRESPGADARDSQRRRPAEDRRRGSWSSCAPVQSMAADQVHLECHHATGAGAVGTDTRHWTPSSTRHVCDRIGESPCPLHHGPLASIGTFSDRQDSPTITTPPSRALRSRSRAATRRRQRPRATHDTAGGALDATSLRNPPSRPQAEPAIAHRIPELNDGFATVRSRPIGMAVSILSWPVRSD